MIPDTFAELVTGWIDRTLSVEQEAELRKLIDQGRIDPNELEELSQFYQAMESAKVPEPTSRMSDRFYAMLETYKNMTTEYSTGSIGQWWRHLLGQIRLPGLAYALVLLMFGFIGGMLLHTYTVQDNDVKQLADQVRSMREMMVVTLLEQPSSFQRLKAVNISSDLSRVDNKVIEALLNTLNNDPNVNVRLEAVDALVRHAGNPLAREGLVRSIDRQNSPLVQVAMADAMVNLREKNAVPDLKKLLAREDLNPLVKERIKSSITKLL